MRVLPGSAVSRVAVVPLISVRHHDGTSQVFSKIGRYLTLSSFPETSVYLPWIYIFAPAGHTKPMNLRYCISNTTTPVRPRYCPKSVSHPSFWKLISSVYLDFSLFLYFSFDRTFVLGQLRRISWITPREKPWAICEGKQKTFLYNLLNKPCYWHPSGSLMSAYA